MHNRMSATGVFLAVLCLAAQAVAATPAQLLTGPPKAWLKANVDLSAAIERAEKSGREPPRLANPKARGLVLAAFDERIFSQMNTADPPSFIWDGDPSGKYINVCAQPVGFILAYNGDGLNPAMLARLKPSDMNVIRARMARNAVAFQDEDTLAFDFAITCYGLQITAGKVVLDATASYEKQLQTALGKNYNGTVRGTQLMAADAPETFTAVLDVQSNRDISVVNRTRMLDRAARYVDAFAALLSPGRRHAGLAAIDRALPSATPENRPKLLRIREALAKPCKGQLCEADPPPAKVASRGR